MSSQIRFINLEDILPDIHYYSQLGVLEKNNVFK